LNFDRYKGNDNRYEGEWKVDKKNGNGKFFFLNKGQMLEGFWIDDINKTGHMIDFDRENATEPTPYLLPKVKPFIFYNCRFLLLKHKKKCNLKGRSKRSRTSGQRCEREIQKY
jgi:hypothetical protein